MNPFLIAAGSKVLDSTVNGITGSITNASAQRRAYRHQLDFWNRQNEYNLPSNQRKRLEDAGMNINGLGGSLSASGSSSVGLPSAPSYGASSGRIPLQESSQLSLNGSLARYYDSAARLNNEKADTEGSQRTYYGALTENLNASTVNEGVKTRILSASASLSEATLQNNIQLSNLAVNRATNECYNLYREAGRQDLYDKHLGAAVQNLQAQTLETIVSSELKSHQVNLTDTQTQLLQYLCREYAVNADVAEETKDTRIEAGNARNEAEAKEAINNRNHSTFRAWMRSIGAAVDIGVDAVSTILDVLMFSSKKGALAAAASASSASAERDREMAKSISDRYNEAWATETHYSNKDGEFIGGKSTYHKRLK
ncbi:DNA pilot protein [Dipodfec virus UOA04_Rod_881]|nr:DNA pilot protein [Dipodfec virus UOA04_Rod_881]